MIIGSLLKVGMRVGGDGYLLLINPILFRCSRPLEFIYHVIDSSEFKPSPSFPVSPDFFGEAPKLSISEIIPSGKTKQGRLFHDVPASSF